MRVIRLVLPALLVLATIACGGAAKRAAPPPRTAAARTTAAPRTTTTTPTTTQANPSGLQGEAGSSATGDIPDNQVFVVFRDAAAGFSMRYPEGWAQQGSGKQVTFRDKNNIVRIVVGPGAEPSPVAIRHQLAALHGVHVQGS